jgi:polyhydroxyalkanoate synthase subunit PhaC
MVSSFVLPLSGSVPFPALILDLERRFSAIERRRTAVIFLATEVSYAPSFAAGAPSNLPLNPAALRRADSTQGKSVIAGLRHWIDDVINNRAMPRQVCPTAYKVGEDLALTPGAVVYRNDLLELIQYAPQTTNVRRRPVLLIPPQINKFYVFDLKPERSLIGHLIRAGLQMFVLSWRNPSRAEPNWGLDRYIESTIQAMDVIRVITCSRTAGIISACAGGYTATALLGYLAEVGDHRITSHSLLVTCLFPNTGSDLPAIVVVLLIAAGWWIVNSLAETQKAQTCHATGTNYCL